MRDRQETDPEMESPRLRTAREKDSIETENSPPAGAKAGDNGVSLSVEDMSRTEPSLQEDSPEGTSYGAETEREKLHNKKGLSHVGKGNKLQFILRDPLKTTSCSKCSRGGHHEFECYSKKGYNSRLCSTCEKFNHFANNCKEVE
jgi:hypothetical protein